MNDLITAYLDLRRQLADLEERLTRLAGPLRIYPVKAIALVLLRSGGPQPVSHLGRALSLKPQSGTELADRLERDGLVERQRHPTDRRIVHLALTAKGEKTAAAVVAALTEPDASTADRDRCRRAHA